MKRVCNFCHVKRRWSSRIFNLIFTVHMPLQSWAGSRLTSFGLISHLERQYYTVLPSSSIFSVISSLSIARPMASSEASHRHSIIGFVRRREREREREREEREKGTRSILTSISSVQYFLFLVIQFVTNRRCRHSTGLWELIIFSFLSSTSSSSH